jgi:hypothetical protein
MFPILAQGSSDVCVSSHHHLRVPFVFSPHKLSCECAVNIHIYLTSHYSSQIRPLVVWRNFFIRSLNGYSSEDVVTDAEEEERRKPEDVCMDGIQTSYCR